MDEGTPSRSMDFSAVVAKLYDDEPTLEQWNKIKTKTDKDFDRYPIQNVLRFCIFV